MRLTVAPGSLWVAYTLTRPDAVGRLLPATLRLAASPLYADETRASPKLLFNLYEVDAPWMRGTRLEVVTLARHVQTRRLHFVVLDCLTDTLQWDPETGIALPNAFAPRGARLVTHPTTYRRELRSGPHRFALRATPARVPRPIARAFAVDANEACYFRAVDRPYAMSFDPDEVGRDVVPLVPRSLVNTLWPRVRSARPSHVFFHPHAMHFHVAVDSFTTTPAPPSVP